METLSRGLDENRMKTIFLICLSLGVVFRIINGIASYGFLVIDDYYYYFSKAYESFQNGAYTPHPFRPPLLSLFIWFDLVAAKFLGITDKVRQLQVVSLSLTLLSIPGLYGVYLYCRNRVRESGEFFFILFLAACFCALPFLSAQKLTECFSLPFIMLGLGLWSFEGRNKPAFFAGLILIGFSALIRFQNGLFFVLLLVECLLNKERRWQIKYYLAAGLVLAGMQVFVDVVVQKMTPFATLINYLLENRKSTRFGIMPFYVFPLLLLGLTLFPLSLAAWRQFWSAFREHREAALMILFYAAVHSLILHKEDRFIIPCLPLLVVILGSVLGKIRASGGRLSKGVFYYPFLVVNTVLLLLFSTYNPQRNIILVSDYFSKKDAPQTFVSNNMFYYFKFFDSNPVRVLRNDLKDPAKFFRDNPRYLKDGVSVVYFDRFGKRRPFPAAGKEFTFRLEKRFNVHPLDSLVFFLNPHFNARRVPVEIYSCAPTSR